MTRNRIANRRGSTVSCALPESESEQFRAACADLGMTRSDVIRQLISQYLLDRSSSHEEPISHEEPKENE